MKGLLRHLKRAVAGWLGRVSTAPAAPVEPVPLRIISELESFTAVDALRTGRQEAAAGIGLVSTPIPHADIEEQVLALRLDGCVGGAGAPAWAYGAGGALRSGVTLGWMAEVHHTPRFGAVIGHAGHIPRSTIQEALYFTPTLTQLPCVWASPIGPVFSPPQNAPIVDRAAIFVTWGALHNYGHFLLDTLPALQSLNQAGLLEYFQPIAPPLTDWQRQLVKATFPDLEIRQVDHDVVRLGEVVFSSCMDHFLHAPNKPLDAVRAAGLKAAAPGDAKLRRLYFSRSDDRKRRLVNEGALESALAQRGFVSVRPGALSVAEQIALMRQADVVVAPTGAALANCLFLDQGAKVFEIQPTNFTGVWVRNLCDFLDVRWYGFFCPSPIERDMVTFDGVSHADVMFDWRLNLEDFLTFLDDRL